MILHSVKKNLWTVCKTAISIMDRSIHTRARKVPVPTGNWLRGTRTLNEHQVMRLPGTDLFGGHLGALAPSSIPALIQDLSFVATERLKR